LQGLLVTSGGDRKPADASSYKAGSDAITFDEFIKSEFAAKYFNGSWWSDTELQWKDQVSF
jgi:hypothetical protein